MVLNASFNNISIMSWRSVLLVEEYGVPRENHQPAAQVTDKFCHIMLHRVRLREIRTHHVNGDKHWLQRSCKSKYHTITTTTTPDSKNDRL
jgi:hypothetical protein